MSALQPESPELLLRQLPDELGCVVTVLMDGYGVLDDVAVRGAAALHGDDAQHPELQLIHRHTLVLCNICYEFAILGGLKHLLDFRTHVRGVDS